MDLLSLIEYLRGLEYIVHRGRRINIKWGHAKEEGMKIISFALLILGLFWLVPGALRADCVGLNGYTSWIPENDQKIIFYMGSRPTAAVKLSDCKVHSNSDVRLIKGYVCGDDNIVIDNHQCKIFSLDSLAF